MLRLQGYSRPSGNTEPYFYEFCVCVDSIQYELGYGIE